MMSTARNNVIQLEQPLLEAQNEVHYRATRFEQHGGWHNEQYLKKAVERLERLEGEV
ncbi:MAG: hypothetical protein WAO78_15340 [Roseovarius sp.]